MTLAVELEGVTARLGRARVLDAVSLAIEAGEPIALAGPSGAGKSTLLRVLLGLTNPTAGIVRLGGRIVSDGDAVVVEPEERGLGMVFQDLALWPHMSVHENLEFGLAARGVPESERNARIARTLADVGLEARARSSPAELSGGERQRVAIARAVVLDPAAVLFDEPLSNLDVVLRRELLGLIRRLCEARGTTAVYVTHDPREATAIGRRIAILERGRLVQVGTPEALRTSPATEFVRSFMGELGA